jgi:hypothetical protein
MHYTVPNLQMWHFQRNNNKKIYLFISFPEIHRSLDFIRHSCRFSALSHGTLLYCITFTTSFSHFTSGRPRRRLRRGDQSFIPL